MPFSPELTLEPEPLVSCIMPTLGRPDYVHEAVAFFLWQDYPHKELIVLNDCPGQEYVGEYCGVRFINRDKRFATVGEKRNACIEAAAGSLIAVWDDDDVYLPWRLSYTVAAVQRFRTHFYRAAEFYAFWGEAKLHDNQSVPGWMNHPSTLYSKEIWREVGGYPARDIGEDAEFFDRIHRLLKQDFIKHPIEAVNRFFIMRGTSKYAHASIGGGREPLDLSPGRRVVVPCSIADPVLRAACDKVIGERYRCAVRNSPSTAEPGLSVCISVKNRSKIPGSGASLLPNCVRSLAAAARQLAMPVELIIADFHSDDWPLADWLASAAGGLDYRLISIAGPFSKGKGLNVAAAEARGRRIMFLDADNLIDVNALRRAVAVVDSGKVWLPIPRCLDRNGKPDFWSDYSLGNVAFQRELWGVTEPVPEFHSWGGEDKIFADDLQGHRPAVRERYPGLWHQWHPEELRDANYSRPRHSEYYELLARRNAGNTADGAGCAVANNTP